MRMPFSGRMERAEKLSKERANLRMHGFDEDIAPIDLMEKGDGLAMLLAAVITIVPICLLVLAVLVGVGYLFMFH